jgi:hypothetical protein
MNVSEISFCGHVGFNIKSDDAKKNILNKLENTYGVKIVAKHFDRFSEDNAEKLMNNINMNLHLICSRTNGNPYFLYLVKINFTNYCIFIDKKIQQGYYYPRMIIAHVFIDDQMFNKDILFDGEMIKLNNNKWVYMINDILVYDNTYLNNMNLTKRINLCNELLEKYYVPTDTDIFKIIVKKYFKYNEFEYLVNTFIPSRKYTCRGIYFRPLYLKFKDILVNFDDSLICKVDRIKYKDVKNFLTLKDQADLPIKTQGHAQTYKRQNQETPILNDDKVEIDDVRNTHDTHAPSAENIDEIKEFQMKKTSHPDVYEISNTNYSGIAYIPNLKTSKMLRALFQSVNLVTKINVKCKWSETFNKWYPIC